MAKVNRRTRCGKSLIKHAEKAARKDPSIQIKSGKGHHMTVQKGDISTCLYPKEMPTGTARAVTKAFIAMGLLFWMVFTVLKLMTYNPGVVPAI